MESLLDNINKIKEGKNTAIKNYVDTGKISQEQFDFFLKNDKSKRKKYVEWMCKMYIKNPGRERHIVDVITAFDELAEQNKIKNKDIYSYKTLGDVDNAIADAEKTVTKSEYKKETKKDSEVVYNTEDLFIVIPKTHAASQLYGAGTEWCTAGRTRRYWDSYTNKGIRFYYIIDKKHDTKFAVAVYLDGTKEIFDINDNSITYKELKDAIGIDV